MRDSPQQPTMSESERPPLRWSKQLDVLPTSSTPPLKGDKIILPPSALEQLLSAATVTVTSTTQPQTSTFDPFNPYSYAAERQAREALVERQQQLPHPLTFRLVNPENGKVVYAGIREFSAVGNTIGLSPFLKHTLGISDKEDISPIKALQNGPVSNPSSTDTSNQPGPRLTVHVQELQKGTYVKLRPLEAGYDPEDWKALLEQHLRNTFTTLTNQEIIDVPARKETFKFLVDGLKPNEEAVSLVDTDIEVDIEPLNEEQARETLQKLALKSQRAPGTEDGSSAGGKLAIDQHETGQVRPGEYVDYSLREWDKSQDLEVELSNLSDGTDIDVFVSPFGSKHRARPREDQYVFGDLSSQATKRIIINRADVALDMAEALWISVRGYPSSEIDILQQGPMQYHLRISSTANDSMSDSETLVEELAPDEERCTNCYQAVPKRTMFLHQNFCLRNNILCPDCHNVFQKRSPEWQSHWHCPHDSFHGNSASSKAKHDAFFHTPTNCPICLDGESNLEDLAHHRTNSCRGKLILCQFCHLEVPQHGPDDPTPDWADLVLSGLTPHELFEGARTTECHLCDKIVRLRDMPAHLKHHDHQRLSRTKPQICWNSNCGRTIDVVTRLGEVRHQAAKNQLGICDVCYGPLWVSTYDPNMKAFHRRVERRYLTQLLTGCKKDWCRNMDCRTGRQHLGLAGEGEGPNAREAMEYIRPKMINLGTKSSSFCTDEASQKRRTVAETMAAERRSATVFGGKGKGKEDDSEDVGYALEWCVAALQVEGDDCDKARVWLKAFAPTRAEQA